MSYPHPYHYPRSTRTIMTMLETKLTLHVVLGHDTDTGETVAAMRIGDDVFGVVRPSADEALAAVLDRVTVPEPNHDDLPAMGDPEDILAELRKAEANDSVIRLGFEKETVSVIRLGSEKKTVYFAPGEYDFTVDQVHSDNSVSLRRYPSGDPVPVNRVDSPQNEIAYALPV
jgi:hypothetical protein